MIPQRTLTVGGRITVRHCLDARIFYLMFLLFLEFLDYFCTNNCRQTFQKYPILVTLYVLLIWKHKK